MKTCGTCQHSKPAQDGFVTCYGNPPTVFPIGSKPGVLQGQVQVIVENLRPVMPEGEMACHLHTGHPMPMVHRVDFMDAPPKPRGGGVIIP